MDLGGKTTTAARDLLPYPAAACAELRSAYHDCFNRWYAEKFSKGQWDKEECVDEWNLYRACLAKHLEDKHLRPLLQEAEASANPSKDDSQLSVNADSGSRR